MFDIVFAVLSLAAMLMAYAKGRIDEGQKRDAQARQELGMMENEKPVEFGL